MTYLDRTPYAAALEPSAIAGLSTVFALLLLASVAASVPLQALAADKAAPATSRTGTKYAADADMQAVLDAHANLGAKAIEKLDATQARLQPTPADAVMAVMKKRGKDASPSALVPGVTSVDRTITGAVGSLPARVYTPAGSGPFPVIVYFHGGGWVIGDKQVYDAGARGLAKEANAIVVSVDYRLAPEAKFPAQHDDALASYRWVAANAASINGDPKRLALAGESAGANLALATAIGARDAGITMPLHVLAVYPIAQGGSTSTESYRDSENARPLSKAMMAWFVDKVFSKPSDTKDPRIDLVNANLKGLPPVTLISAQIDPLRSDSDQLEAALRKAGVKVEHKLYEGVTHEFFGMAAVVAKAREAQALAGARLKQSLAALSK